MAVSPQKIERKDSTSFESVLIEDKTQLSSKPISLNDIIIKEEGKVFKEQKKKEKEKESWCNNNDDDCFICSFWCCFCPFDCDCNC